MSFNLVQAYARAPMVFERGEGSWLFDTQGEKWLDAGAGIAVNVLGHADPRLVRVLTEQAGRLWHTSNLYRIAEQERLAQALTERTFAASVFFTNSGTEACEAAVKMARRYWHIKGSPERNEIITLNASFHGRSLGMISAAGGEKLIDGFSPLLPGFRRVDANDSDAVAEAVDANTAAIMVEPVLGEGGILPLEDWYLAGLRELCDRTGCLLILDEIQCGMGRTGKLFAHEWTGIEPDIMAIAKGIGGGFPLGACLAKAHAAEGISPGTHGSTYGGNPLACRIGREVLDIVAEPEFLADVREKAGRLRQRLEAVVATRPDIFTEIRGSGLMLGLVCKVPGSDVIEAGYRRNLLTVPASGNVVRILPPLTATPDELDEVCLRLDSAAAEIEAGSHA
ncbi:MAG: aspartate aminotransferase family protein [Rhodobacteraceae bacterium]|nr:aspartate aminotransferase family protein [Paracoccaceae bacterium]